MINLALNVAAFLFLAFVGFMILIFVVGTEIGRGLVKIIFGLLVLAGLYLLINIKSPYWNGAILVVIFFVGWIYDKFNHSTSDPKQLKTAPEPDPHPIYARIGKILIYLIIGLIIFIVIADTMGIFPH